MARLSIGQSQGQVVVAGFCGRCCGKQPAIIARNDVNCRPRFLISFKVMMAILRGR